jgi:hypothetical protein
MRVVDVVKEALDIEQHDPALETGAMSSLDVMEEGEARVEARGVSSPAKLSGGD